MTEGTTKNLHQRIAEAMTKVTYIQREAKRGMQYTITSHDAVTAKVRPVLLECGVIYYPHNMTHRQEGNRTEVSMLVRFANIDDPSDRIDVPTLGYGIDPQDKGPGKAISYAVKYALLKTLGLETGDDPDNDNIDHGPDPQKAVPKDDTPPFNSRAASDRIIGRAAKAQSISALDEVWATEKDTIKMLTEPHFLEVKKAFQTRKVEIEKLAEADRAMQGPGDIDEGHQYQ